MSTLAIKSKEKFPGDKKIDLRRDAAHHLHRVPSRRAGIYKYVLQSVNLVVNSCFACNEQGGSQMASHGLDHENCEFK